MAAVVACAPKGHGFEMDCRECRHDSTKRAAWGCDAPAAEPVAWVAPCPWCGGREPACEHCAGENRVPVNRCPNATVKPEHLQLINAALLAEKGVLQDAGGWLDQSCTFATVFPLLCGEIAHWREVATKAAMDKSKSKRR